MKAAPPVATAGPSHAAGSSGSSNGNGASLAQQAPENSPAPADDPSPKKIKHRGFVLQPQVGLMGCTRSVCAGDSGHDAGPGVNVGAFVGANIAGWVELGLAGSWGQLSPRIGEGSNALGLFGIGPNDIPDEAAVAGFDYNDYATDSAKLDDVRVGAAVRLHLAPRGRVSAYLGTGFGYHLFRGKYDTRGGQARLSFHGLDIPMQAGLGGYLSKRVALGVEFNYLWTYFAAVSIRHPDANMVAPLGLIEARLQERDISLTRNLPQFWTATLGLRITL